MVDIDRFKTEPGIPVRKLTPKEEDAVRKTIDFLDTMFPFKKSDKITEQ